MQNKRITFCRPAKAQQNGPNRSKMILREPPPIRAEKTIHDIYQKNYELIQTLKLIRG